MLNCEKCVKNDVCGKKDEVCELLKKMSLSGIYQSLTVKNIKVDIKCDNYLENKENQTFRSVNDILDEIKID